MSNIYDLSDFKIIKEQGFDYTIPDESRDLITLLANLVGSPNYSKSPYFIKSDKKKKKAVSTSNIGWDMLRAFKKTEIKEKSETEQKLDEIRILMNKITNDSFTMVSKQIKQHIHSVSDNELHEKLIALLFKIASSNRFYSALYARLYTDIVNDCPTLKMYFNTTLEGYIELFKIIESCNPDEDYNKFCDINKQNENRRAISCFIVNCMLLNNIEVKVITDLIYYLQKLMVDNNTDIMKIEEITENFFILVECGLDKIVLSDDWGNIYEYIQQNSLNKCFNNKIRFKFMDLLDLTN
tara:strand:- start:53 stop:940 length:888 start_codon:yes stop_codon:yes gene_type:complete